MHQDALKLNAEALPLVHGVPRLAVPVVRAGKCKGKPVGHEPRDTVVNRTEFAISPTITPELASRPSAAFGWLRYRHAARRPFGDSGVWAARIDEGKKTKRLDTRIDPRP